MCVVCELVRASVAVDDGMAFQKLRVCAVQWQPAYAGQLKGAGWGRWSERGDETTVWPFDVSLW